MSHTLSFRVDGQAVCLTVAGHERLLDVLRDRLGLTGTHEGCGQGECGACTVLVDDRPVNACLYPAPEVDGRRVTTIAGLAGRDGALSDVQQAFVDCGAIQCGFCTPGMVLSAHALLARDPDPDDAAIRAALVGNLCRCTGYVQIVEAVRTCAARRRAAAGGTP